MKCPSCGTNIKMETVQVDPHSEGGGVDLTLKCKPCGTYFTAEVSASQFELLPLGWMEVA